MLNLTQRQTLQQRLSPAQVQYLQILQLPLLQLEQKIKDELELNPLLEEGVEVDDELEDIPDQEREDGTTVDKDDEYVLENGGNEEDFIEKEIRDNPDEEYTWDEFFENNEGHTSTNYFDSEDGYEFPAPAVVTMRERLLDQTLMLNLSEEERLLADIIVWNLDDDGYLRADLDELVQQIQSEHGFIFTLADAERLLRSLQRLDPPGIASRNLRECLLVQLDMLPNTSTARIIAIRILRDAYDLFVKKHFDKIMHELRIDEAMLKKAFDLIRTLNPKPGEGDAVETLNHVIPDFLVTREGSEFTITLNDRGIPPLRLNKSYKQLLQYEKKRMSTEARSFLRQKMESAKWFIQSIQQRRQTMYNVMWSIVMRQREWFELGKGHLRPLVYKDIADDIEMDISTISRVVNGKYVQTEWGVYELRYYFSEGIATNTGEEISNKEVMAILKEIIENENSKKPYSDQALTDILQERGFAIARRTVAKYRESMDIPVSRLRKRLD